jgi:hypothetical protein
VKKTSLNSPHRAWHLTKIIALIGRIRLSYLPPLMVYMAAGISGLTGIVGTFFIKEYLDLPAEFLAMLGFWAGLPWALKMPLGHLVDLIWHWKSLLVLLGALLISASLAIMIALIGSPSLLTPYMPLASWFVLAALLSPVGYVLQDVVADAMTVEAVPAVDDEGNAFDAPTLKSMHTTMQTLGRMAVIGGGLGVSLINMLLFNDVNAMDAGEKIAVYIQIYTLAMIIPLISVSGVVLAEVMKVVQKRKRKKYSKYKSILDPSAGVVEEKIRPNWWILGGSLTFVIFTLTMGLLQIPYNQELVFAGSMAVVLFLMAKLVKELTPVARRTLVTTAIVIFVFRAVPGPGAAASWWQIDELGFDQHFMAQLSLISSSLTLAGMFIFRRFMAEKSIFYVVGFLSIAGALLSLPIIGMYYGLHHWTAGLTAGIVDARFIAVIDTALESPLGQIAMIPMLAWIAGSAPAHLKATFFAVMASFTNLALSLSSLLTKYLNTIFTVSREVVDPSTGQVQIAADYSQLGILLMIVTAIGLVMPLTAIFLAGRVAGPK